MELTSGPFLQALATILQFVENRPGVGKLPGKAWAGQSFSTDEIGTSRVEGIALDAPCYWTLRFDDDDGQVARRSWVMETALGIHDRYVLFGTRLQCAVRGKNPSYNRSIPGFVREVIQHSDARLDNRRVESKPWIVNTETEVDRLVELLRSPNRTADAIVISLPEDSSDPADELIASAKLAHDLAGVAHIVLISGPCSFRLSDLVGREFSVFNQAVRTYQPGFDPDKDEPFAHPLGIADRIRAWSGGTVAYQRFITNVVLRRTVEGTDVLNKLPSFAEAKRNVAEAKRNAAEAKRNAAELRHQNADSTGLTDVERLKLELALTNDENAYLKEDRDSYKELLEIAESERDTTEAERNTVKAEHDDAQVEVQRLEARIYNLKVRNEALASANPGYPIEDNNIPDSLDGLEDWAARHLSGSVELHNRALRSAKKSEYDDVSLIYEALLLLRDYYVPMRLVGGQKRKKAFEQHCLKLGLKEGASSSESRAGEQGDDYFISVGKKKIKLDRHLKKGTSHDPRECFRLYFCWDDTLKQVVVGWLPSHLHTRSS